MANNRSMSEVRGGGPGNGDDGLEKYELWKEIKVQVKLLKEDMDSSKPSTAVTEVHPGHEILSDEGADGMREGVMRWETGTARELPLRRQNQCSRPETEHNPNKADRPRTYESLDAFARFEPLDHFERVPDVL